MTKWKIILKLNHKTVTFMIQGKLWYNEVVQTFRYKTNFMTYSKTQPLLPVLPTFCISMFAAYNFTYGLKAVKALREKILDCFENLDHGKYILKANNLWRGLRILYIDKTAGGLDVHSLGFGGAPGKELNSLVKT
eukprot:UN03221